MKRRRSLRGGVFACVLLFVTACTSSGDVTTGPDAPSDSSTATPIATTAPAEVSASATPSVPTAMPSPTALVLPDASPTPAPEREPATAVPSPPATTNAPVPATVTPAPANQAPTTIPTTPPVSGSQTVLAANGAEVYTLNCARCHAENGLGTAQYSATLVGVGGRYTSQGMVAELTSGHPVTFGFADKLSAEEIASVVAYVKAAFP